MIAKLTQIFIILLQLSFAWFSALVIYMIFAILDFESGFVEFIGLLIFQPILGIVLVSFSVVVCFLAGLPIRLNPKMKKWWIKHFYIAIIGVFMALFLFVLSFLPAFRETVTIQEDEGWERTKEIPNLTLVLFAWFMFIFMALHAYPPQFFVNKAEQFLGYISIKIKGLLNAK